MRRLHRCDGLAISSSLRYEGKGEELDIQLSCPVAVYQGGARPGFVESMGRSRGSGSWRCASSFSLILAAALRALPLPWVGDGSWGRNPAFAGTTVGLASLRAPLGVALRAPRPPWMGDGSWGRNPASAGTTVGLDPSAVLRTGPSPVLGTGSVLAPLAEALRALPLPWVGDGSWGRNPAFAGTTVVVAVSGESPSPQPSP